MRKNYKGFAWRLENIKSVCNALVKDILGDYSTFSTFHEDEDFMKLTVRVVVDEKKFGYVRMGDFFFIDDCMYVISDDDLYKDSHNEDIKELASDLFEVPYTRSEKYLSRVIFAGVRTPYKDNLDDWVYTGDMVNANDDIISGVSAFPPYNDEDEIIMPDNYGLMLDNCMFPLRDCKTIERLGTIYFGLDRESTTEIDLESFLSGHVQHSRFDDDFLLCAKYTPSFQQEMWRYSALGILGIEEDNWRR
ncbi:MAG TPA: hypothetical protein PKW49_05455 [Paludibacteraceae bacterium]|mgnify:FL=1|nr:hypothetical protein [Paludibacteraceae bacterium]HQF50323.1 hypothetical protein [Paludibacteraceae bacterium]